MKRSSFLKTVFSLCLMMAMCWTPMKAQLHGDVNGSGDVTISDVTELIDLLLSNTASDKAYADINGDGVVNITDVTALINYLLSHEWPEVYEPEYLTITVGSTTFRMLLVEGGTFTMGARENDPYVRPWEKPAHEVTLSDFYIAEFEVTQELWRAVMGTSTYNNTSWFVSSNGYTTNYKRPAESMTYSEAKSFITKLNQKTGKTFRLPTESEWEYAARGGKWSKGYLYIGGDNVDEVAWHAGNKGEDITKTVGTKAPNELGLYDMGGNVEEWVSDYYADSYTSRPATDPTGPTNGTARVIRGGSWDQAFRMCRPTSRHDASEAFMSAHTGMRVAMSR